MMCACHPSYSRKHKIGSQTRTAWAKKQDAISKMNSKKKVCVCVCGGGDGGMAQAVEHPPSKYEIPNSNSSTTKLLRTRSVSDLEFFSCWNIYIYIIRYFGDRTQV
jgi:hypothetical protein